MKISIGSRISIFELNYMEYMIALSTVFTIIIILYIALKFDYLN